MTAFDRAWGVVKMPLFTGDTPSDDSRKETGDYDPEDFMDYERGHVSDSARFRLLPTINRNPTYINNNINGMYPRFFESKAGDARGYATLREGNEEDDPLDDYHQISLFEMANDSKGQGLSRARLQEFIDELREYDPSAKSTHLTHSERNTADFWDKLVDEGLIDSASTKPYVTTTPDGKIIPYINRSDNE